MASIFSKIVKGEIPSYRIAADERFYAFLDINPVAKGHTLIIPKHEVDYIFDVDDKTLGYMMIFAKRVAEALKKVVACKRVGVAVLGLEVPHAHIHLIPINSEADFSFSKPRVKLTKEEFEQLASDIRSQL